MRILRYTMAAMAAVLLISCGTEGTTSVSSGGVDAYEPDQADEIEQWYDDNAYIIDLMSSDLDDIMSAAEDGDLYFMEEACLSLRDHVAEAQSADPMPADEVDLHWQDALDDYRSAAAYCLSGVSSYDASDFTKSADFLASGTDHIEDATAAVERLSN